MPVTWHSASIWARAGPWSSPADGPSAFADASVRLTGAGYESLAEQTQPEGSFGVFQNDKYQVQLTIADTNDFGLAATYVAALRG